MAGRGPLIALGVLLPGILACAGCGRQGQAAATAVPTGTARVVRTDIAQRQSVSGSIAFTDPGTIVVPAGSTAGVLTWLPPPGAVVDRGLQLYRVDDRPVVLMLGDVPQWRQITYGASGPDVRELEQNLIALGFANSDNLATDGLFTAADASAVSRWQASLGLPQSGVVGLGAVHFAKGPLRVTSVRALVGASLPVGGPLLEVTSARRFVTIPLETGYLSMVKVGDPVTITLPDNRTTTAGTVSTVGSVATVPPTPLGQAGPVLRPTVPIAVDVPDQHALAGYDQAPVQAAITANVHKGVLAVPVTALLAQPDGSYAIKVRRGAGMVLTTVTPGLFSGGGLVEVSGQGLGEGDLVQVPQQ